MNSLLQFLETFGTEKSCQQHLYKQRFGQGLYCPRCGHKKIYQFKDGHTYKCASCRKKFNIRTGTIFEKSPLTLAQWFLAIFLISSNRKGISSINLAEMIGVTQPTAWYMAHRIRETYIQKKNKLKGPSEGDETYLGGKRKNMHAYKRLPGDQGRSTLTKTPVIGLAERYKDGKRVKKKDQLKGQIRMIAVKSVTKKVVADFVNDNLDEKAELIADEYHIYDGLSTRRVNHSEEQYVIGEDHTNSIESVWALFKRGYMGTFHWISRKHMQRYLDEFATRLTLIRQKLSIYDRFTYCLQNIDCRLTYKELING